MTKSLKDTTTLDGWRLADREWDFSRLGDGIATLNAHWENPERTGMFISAKVNWRAMRTDDWVELDRPVPTDVCFRNDTEDVEETLPAVEAAAGLRCSIVNHADRISAMEEHEWPEGVTCPYDDSWRAEYYYWDNKIDDALSQR